jgi:hypothetical protein
MIVQSIGVADPTYILRNVNLTILYNKGNRGERMSKMCPFTFSTGTVGKLMGKGLPRDCMEDECAWWTDTKCSILAIAENSGKR